MSKNAQGSSGVGLAGVLLVVFIVLKLTGLIDWDWVWVLAPAWISLCVFLLVFVLIVLGALLFGGGS